MKSNKGFSSVVIVLGILILALGSYFGYQYFNKFETSKPIERMDVANPDSISAPIAIKPEYVTDIIISKENYSEKQRITENSPEQIAILDEVEGDLYNKWQPIPGKELTLGYKFYTTRLDIVYEYLKNDKYEVLLAGCNGLVTKDIKSEAEFGGGAARCLYSKSNEEGSKWTFINSYQNPVSCLELDKLGFTKAQTIEWECFNYEEQQEGN